MLDPALVASVASPPPTERNGVTASLADAGDRVRTFLVETRDLDPRAVSHPWLLEEKFGRQRVATASGVEYEQGQAARETPAKTTRTVPLELNYTATGEVFDVV